MTASTSYIHVNPEKEVLFLLNEHFESKYLLQNNCCIFHSICAFDRCYLMFIIINGLQLVGSALYFVCLCVFISHRISVFCLPTQFSMFHTVCLSVGMFILLGLLQLSQTFRHYRICCIFIPFSPKSTSFQTCFY